MHGKTEVRKELALIAIAHRGVFVHQSSQASAAHLVGGVLRGLQQRRPAIFNLYTPCPVEHGLADDVAQRAARLALESRAFPFLTFDPEAGPSLADSLSLEGNPSLDDKWPAYTLEYTDDAGTAQKMELPLTTADWAATEGRFKKHFTPLPKDQWNEDCVAFHEYLQLSAEDREGKTAFIHTLDSAKHLNRLSASPEMVKLAEERQQFWSQLKELAGLEPSAALRDRLVGAMQAEHEQQMAALKKDYERQLAVMRTTYPQAVARRMAEALLRGTPNASAPVPMNAPAANGKGGAVANAPAAQLAPAPSATAPVAAPVAVSAAPALSPVESAGAVATVASESDDALAIDPWIDSARCTTCNECTNLNGKLFMYNDAKQATIKNPDGGSFQHLVVAAERCPVGIIHPGTPRNPKEKDLAKWVKRAEPFS